MTRPRTPDEFEKFVKKAAKRKPISRTSIRRVYGDRVSRTGELFGKDEIEFESDDGLEKLTFFASGSCDRGHVVGDGVEIAGRCSCCGRFVCSVDGCARMCVKGHLCCGSCSVTTSEGFFCTAHVGLLVGKTAARGTGKLLGAFWRALNS